MNARKAIPDSGDRFIRPITMIRNLYTFPLLVILAVVHSTGFGQPVQINDPYLIINAGGSDPVYTTYTAAIERSKLYGDKGYTMDYYSGCMPVIYGSEKGGRFYSLWKINQVVVRNISEFFAGPTVIASFPDMAIIEYQPYRGVTVQETFFVYSSSLAAVYLNVLNTASTPQQIELYPIYQAENDSMLIQGFDTLSKALMVTQNESLYRLVSSLRATYPYPTSTRTILAAGSQLYSFGAYHASHSDLYDIIKTDFYAKTRSDKLNERTSGMASLLALQLKFTLQPGEQKQLWYFRGWQDAGENPQNITDQINQLKRTGIQRFADVNQQLYCRIPRIRFDNREDKILYLSAFNLARGCMLPPSEKTSYNFYVFSREPLWGWGHGHQVLHESLSMLAYAYLDPVSAQGSQRVYMEQQRDDGLIAYRHGPRGMQDYPHYSKYLDTMMSTTSAPFYSWINLEIFKISRDTVFLKDAYASGVRYTNWLLKNRDLDRDGMFEWGPYGLIENVRDWYNAVFQVSAERYLDVDKEDISDDLECLDLTVMIIKEMRSLSEMAALLGMSDEAKAWKQKAEQTGELVNRYMWCDDKKFYFSIKKDDHSFFYLTRDLRREEIIGFLPLWAGIVPDERIPFLIDKLTDETKFWRKYGIPTLAADDEWYNPHVDYCCKWNGPVWLLWNYMVLHGLRNYKYHSMANALSINLLEGVKVQLRKNHRFWESYSPDFEVLNCPPNYIWDTIVARILIDMHLPQR